MRKNVARFCVTIWRKIFTSSKFRFQKKCEKTSRDFVLRWRKIITSSKFRYKKKCAKTSRDLAKNIQKLKVPNSKKMHAQLKRKVSFVGKYLVTFVSWFSWPRNASCSWPDQVSIGPLFSYLDHDTGASGMTELLVRRHWIGMDCFQHFSSCNDVADAVHHGSRLLRRCPLS